MSNTILRNYENCSDEVTRHYLNMRRYQTVDHVKAMRSKYNQHHINIKVWDALNYLNTCIDTSDPDMNLPNVHHLFQTAEGLRNDNHSDWMQLIGLLHDLGKVLYKFGCNEDGTSIGNQWSVTGDTFIVGCKLPTDCIFPEFNELNPDMQDNRYNTLHGIYEPNCGLDSCLCAYGHDEYMYSVLMNSKHNIPHDGLRIIRYHSLYPWHSGHAYRHLMNDSDYRLLELVKVFNQYDLYTKENVELDIDDLHNYYNSLINKYIPSGYLTF